MKRRPPTTIQECRCEYCRPMSSYEALRIIAGVSVAILGVWALLSVLGVGK